MGRFEPVDLRVFCKDKIQDFTVWLAEEANPPTVSETLCLLG